MKKNYVVGGLLGLALCVFLAPALWALFRRDPTPKERDNARTIDALLTAITLNNRRLLEECAQRAKTQRDAGDLREEEYRGMEAVAAKARAGDWTGAEREGYAFRRKHPFIPACR